MAKNPGIHVDFSGIWNKVQDELRNAGIDIDYEIFGDETNPSFKVEIQRPDLKDSVREMNKKPRDQVVMVRLDEETVKRLEDWVESGAVKSRSEAAALFIREGLKNREQELEQLQEALKEVEKAKDRLRRRAREVFGEEEQESKGEEKPEG